MSGAAAAEASAGRINTDRTWTTLRDEGVCRSLVLM
jgi:hypothetical protein